MPGLTTHNFHWNVTGPMLNTLHVMFMEQYTEGNAVDPIAERAAEGVKELRARAEAAAEKRRKASPSGKRGSGLRANVSSKLRGLYTWPRWRSGSVKRGNRSTRSEPTERARR